MALTECPQFSLINMLEGPTAKTGGGHYTADEEFNSQEIFTQEKYFYLFYQGLRMLDYFYKLGVTHGHINATNLKIKDDYSLCISEFSIAQFTPEYSKLTEQEQEAKKQSIRGYNRDTMSDHLQKVILRESFALDPDFREDNEDELKLGKCDEFTVRELMQEDWRDFIASFFFSKQSSVITDERIQNFL